MNGCIRICVAFCIIRNNKLYYHISAFVTGMISYPIDSRYSVEKIPLYDSAEDEPTSKLLKIMESFKSELTTQGKGEYSTMMDVTVSSEYQLESPALPVQPLESEQIMNEIKNEDNNDRQYMHDTPQPFTKPNAMISRIRSNSACRNYQIGNGSSSKKRPAHFLNGRSKNFTQKKVDAKRIAQVLASKEAQDEIIKYEEMKSYATNELDSLYNEIRPVIEEHERDTQDSVPTAVAEKWIESSCFKMKAEFDLHFSIIKNLAFNRQKSSGQANTLEASKEIEIKFLTI